MTVDDHLRVIDDLLGAALGRVGERSGERPVGEGLTGHEIAGSVDDGAQVGRIHRAGDGPGVADAAPGVGEDGGGRRGDLDEAEPGGFDLLEHRP